MEWECSPSDSDNCIFVHFRMSGAEHATEAAKNLKGMEKYLNTHTIAGRRNVSRNLFYLGAQHS